MKNEKITSGLDHIKNKDFSDSPGQLQDRHKLLTQLNYDLKTLQHQQITDIWASFPTRLGRYVKIRLIKYTLNQFKP